MRNTITDEYITVKALNTNFLLESAPDGLVTSGARLSREVPRSPGDLPGVFSQEKYHPNVSLGVPSSVTSLHTEQYEAAGLLQPPRINKSLSLGRLRPTQGISSTDSQDANELQ